MRQHLASLGTTERYWFTGIFERYGYRAGAERVEPTILLTSVRLADKQLIATQSWFKLSKGFRDLGELKPGDKLKFSGRVAPYIEDYRSAVTTDFSTRNRSAVTTDFSTSSVNYRIGYPSKIKLVRPLIHRHRPALPTELDALVQQISRWNTHEQV